MIDTRKFQMRNRRVPMKQLEKLKPFDDKSGNLRMIIYTPV